MACLSSRIPYGEPVTPEKLRMIEEAEYVLRDLGFHDVRVRHHEGSSKFQVQGSKLKVLGGAEPAELGAWNLEPGTDLARIEVGAAELPRLLATGTSARVAEALKQIGYAQVTVDLQGYRRGSLNEANGAPLTNSGATGAKL